MWLPLSREPLCPGNFLRRQTFLKLFHHHFCVPVTLRAGKAKPYVRLHIIDWKTFTVLVKLPQRVLCIRVTAFSGRKRGRPYGDGSRCKAS